MVGLGFFAKGNFCSAVCCGSEDNMVIGMKDADLRQGSADGWVLEVSFWLAPYAQLFCKPLSG